MAKKSTNRPKASPKSANGKSAKSKESSPKASEEFGGGIYASDDWKALKKKHPGGFEATLGDLEKRVLISSFDLDNEASGDPNEPRSWKPKFCHNFPGDDSDG